LNIRPSVLFTLILAILSIFTLVIQLSGSLDPDVSWINFGAQRMLAGAKLYRDVIEVNPPMIYYLSMPPLWLAELTGGSANHLYLAWVLLLAALSSIASFNLFSPMGSTWTNGYFRLCVAHFAISTVLVGESFGQREHYLFMLLAPYVFLQIARLEVRRISPPLAALIGASAAVGLSLKPHYVWIVISLEALRLLVGGNGVRALFRPETIAGLVTGACLVAALLLFHPEFVSVIIPLGTKAYLPFYREDARIIFALFGLLVALVCFYAWIARQRGKTSAGSVLITAAAASSFVMLIQFRGFHYQMLLALFFLLLCSAYWGLAKPNHRYWWTTIAGVGTLICLILFNSPLAYYPPYPDGRQTPAGKSIAVFSTNIRDGFPWTSEQGLKWTSRFPSLWFLPYVAIVDLAVQTHFPVEQSDVDLANGLRQQTVDDLVANNPDVILIKTYPPEMDPRPPDYLVVLSKDPRFSNFFSNYEFKNKQGDFEVYHRKQAN
jgi:hypothetical protein